MRWSGRSSGKAARAEMAQTSTLPARPQGPPARLAVQRAIRTYSFGFAAVLAIGMLVANIATVHGGFGVADQLANVAPMAIAALASAPSIIAGGFDISISPLIVLTNAVYIVWLAPNGLGGAVSVPIILGLGLAVGVLNGLLIIVLRVQAIVVTLAMFFSLLGVVLFVAPNPVSIPSSGWVQHLAGSVGPVPGAVFTIGLPLLIWSGLRLVPLGRLLYAVGSNDTTAFAGGVNVNAVRVASYGLGGLFAGFGGLALTGLVGPLLGAFSIYLMQNLLATFAINPAYLQIVYGGILIVAVVLGGAVSRDSGGGLRRTGASLGPRRRRPVQPPLTLLSKGDREVEPAPVPQTPLRMAWGMLGKVQARFPVAQVVALIVVFIYGAISLPGLGSWTAIRSILVLAALVGLASGGQTLLILIGGFDLGVSGFIVAGALTVTALRSAYHLSFGVSLLLAVVGAGLLGGAAGYICHRFAINQLVVTLAMGTLAIGIVAVLNGGLVNGNSPPWLSDLAEPATRTFGLSVPPSIVIWAVVLVLFAILLHRTRLGRSLLATGANSRAADYALVSTRRVWTATFAFSAIASALVGLLIGGFAGTISDGLGDPYLFQSVVSVIVGGTVFGGPGDYTRTCVGALFLTVLTTVLVGHGASPAVEEIVYGLIILAAIAVYGRQRRLRDRL